MILKWLLILLTLLSLSSTILLCGGVANCICTMRPTSKLVRTLNASISRSSRSKSSTKTLDSKRMISQPITNLSLTFLGTSAGKPSLQRAVSSLALKADGKVWLFDCGEGTQRQILRTSNEIKIEGGKVWKGVVGRDEEGKERWKVVRVEREDQVVGQLSGLKLGAITKVFITHLHGDHLLGLAPLLLSIPSDEDPTSIIQIYGPPGLRAHLRLTFRLSCNFPEKKFQVNELHSQFVDHDNFSNRELDILGDPESLIPNEVKGKNIQSDHPSKRIWKEICIDETLSVDAGTILHRVPCLGYVITEAPRRRPFDIDSLKPILEKNREALWIERGIKNPSILLGQLQKNRKSIDLPDGTTLKPPPLDRPGRKVTILGDTFDASNMVSIAQDTSVLVHECTNAHISWLDQNMSLEQVTERAKDHGHSTPQVAGSLARSIKAKMLLLNHLSPRYKLEGDGEDDEVSMDIARQAGETWKGGEAITTRDFYTIQIPLPN